MAAITTVVSNKGGVGKTITTKFLADYASRILKKKTLVIDLDPQTNLSKRYLDMVLNKTLSEEWSPPPHESFNEKNQAAWEQYPTSSSIWLYGWTWEYKTENPNLFIYPGSSKDLQRIEHVTDSNIYSEVVMQFKNYMALKEEIQDKYDYVFIDTRPSKGPLVKSALNASDYCLIPTEMEAPSLEGISGLLSLISITNGARNVDDKLKLLGILPNKVRNIRLHQDNLDAFNSEPSISKYMIPDYMKDLVVYKESMAVGGMNILDFPDSNLAKKDYLNAMKYIFDSMEGK